MIDAKNAKAWMDKFLDQFPDSKQDIQNTMEALMDIAHGREQTQIKSKIWAYWYKRNIEAMLTIRFALSDNLKQSDRETLKPDVVLDLARQQVLQNQIIWVSDQECYKNTVNDTIVSMAIIATTVLLFEELIDLDKLTVKVHLEGEPHEDITKDIRFS